MLPAIEALSVSAIDCRVCLELLLFLKRPMAGSSRWVSANTEHGQGEGGREGQSA